MNKVDDNQLHKTDEAKELVRQANDLKNRFPIAPFPACGNLSHMDNLPGASVYVRNSDQISRVLGKRPCQVLDWGCGYGQMTWLLANRGYKVTATDLPGAYYQHSELLKHPDVTWLSATDPINIDVPSGSFDAVVSSGVLEHAPNIQASMKELWRVLKPGGYLFVFRFPNEWSYIEWFGRRTASWHHPIRMTRRELHFLMKMNSFEDLRMGYDTILPVNCMNPYTLWFRPLRERFHSSFYWLDQILIRFPLTSFLSTSIWLVARKMADYVEFD